MSWKIHKVNNQTGRIVMKSEEGEELELSLPTTHTHKPESDKANWIKEQTDAHDSKAKVKAFNGRSTKRI